MSVMSSFLPPPLIFKITRTMLREDVEFEHQLPSFQRVFFAAKSTREMESLLLPFTRPFNAGRSIENETKWELQFSQFNGQCLAVHLYFVGWVNSEEQKKLYAKFSISLKTRPFEGLEEEFILIQEFELREFSLRNNCIGMPNLSFVEDLVEQGFLHPDENATLEDGTLTVLFKMTLYAPAPPSPEPAWMSYPSLAPGVGPRPGPPPLILKKEEEKGGRKSVSRNLATDFGFGDFEEKRMEAKKKMEANGNGRRRHSGYSEANSNGRRRHSGYNDVYYEKLLRSGEGADVVFLMVEGAEWPLNVVKRINAHRKILTIKSPSFAKLFKTHLEEEVIVCDVSSHVMEIVLKFIYTSELDDNWKLDPVEMIYAAKKYELKTLINFLDINVWEALTPQNAKRVKDVASMFQMVLATQSAVQFIIESRRRIL